MVAGKLAKLPRGGDQRSDQSANLRVGPTQKQAAEMLSISERALQTAKQVQRGGTPELHDANWHVARSDAESFMEQGSCADHSITTASQPRTAPYCPGSG